MIDYQITINKPEVSYTVGIKIEFVIGFVVNLNESGTVDQSVWVDLNDDISYQQHLDGILIDHKGIVFNIFVDHDSVFESNLNNICTHINIAEFSLCFNNTQLTHNLKFQFQGFENRHMPLTSENTSTRAAVKITNIWFDDISIMPIYNSQSKFVFDQTQIIGNSIFSCNGISVMHFNTPIYRWLLDHRKLISY